MRMPFGKYKDELIQDVPTDYLEWMLREMESPAMRRAAQQELERRVLQEERQRQQEQQRQQQSQQQHQKTKKQRKAERQQRQQQEAQQQARQQPKPPPRQPIPEPVWEKVLREWFSLLAKKDHPDRGGSTEAMRVLNDAREVLQQTIGKNMVAR